MSRAIIPSRKVRLCAAFTAASFALAACEDGAGLGGMLAAKDEAAQAAPAAGGKTVERDIEAPEVFSATEEGLWDGRPSLGGVWVAHPDVDEPERVIIRNTGNGKFVVGALFRKERDLPGPKLQISSDAAAALGILAGAPAPLNVTALRREEVATDAPAETDDVAIDASTDDIIAAPAPVAEQSLDPLTTAAAAIDAAPATPKPPAPAPKPKPVVSSLNKPFVQIGIFSVEANADRTAKQMRSAGLVPTVKRQEANGKPFWRVLVGPATSASELKSILSTIKGEGFSDAYAVTN